MPLDGVRDSIPKPGILEVQLVQALRLIQRQVAAILPRLGARYIRSLICRIASVNGDPCETSISTGHSVATTSSRVYFFLSLFCSTLTP